MGSYHYSLFIIFLYPLPIVKRIRPSHTLFPRIFQAYEYDTTLQDSYYVRERVQSYNISIQAYEYDTTLQDSYYVRETVQSYNISTRI